MASTYTASAMKLGLRAQRRSALMCMGLSMCPRARRRAILWRLKVRSIYFTPAQGIEICEGGGIWCRRKEAGIAMGLPEPGCFCRGGQSGRNGWTMGPALKTAFADFDGLNHSQTTHRAPKPSQRRTILHRCPRANTPQYSRKYKRQGQVVEHISAGSFDWGGHISSLVAQEVL